jgi:hypothetical protein
MSYEKAMKHWRNIRKCKKQQHQYFGFDCSDKPTPSVWSNPYMCCILNIHYWFPDRNEGDAEKRAYNRSSIREQIAEARVIFATEQARKVEMHLAHTTV